MKISTSSSTKIDDQHQQVDVGEPTGDHSCSCRKPAGAGPRQWWASSSASSRARIAIALVGLGVVVPEHVQDAVHDQQGQLVVERAGVLGRLPLRRPPGR